MSKIITYYHDGDEVVRISTGLPTMTAARVALAGIGLTLRGVWRKADQAAHRWPWVLVTLVMLVAIVTAYASIATARSERDASAHRAYLLQQRLDSMEAAYGKEAAR